MAHIQEAMSKGADEYIMKPFTKEIIEEKIKIEASKFIKRLEECNYRIWGIYPIQKVVLNPLYYPDSNLYCCPNIKLSIHQIKNIILKHK